MTEIKKLFFDKDELTIDWSDGRQSKLATIWLRDHCQMPQSRDLISGQRLINITDIPLNIAIENVESNADSVSITYAPDNYYSEFKIEWLLQNCYCLNCQFDDRSEASKTLWRGDDFKTGLPTLEYTEYCHSDEIKIEALESVRDFGFIVFNNVPCVPEQVLEVVKTFGFVRETNYGLLFEVRAEVNASNLAFTNLGLGCHLDNPYRDPVPGLQLLHCLESSTSGGESILQDGFMAAHILRCENPAHFETLSQQWINYRFRDSSADLRSRLPMFEVNDLNQLVKVRYNNRSIDTLRINPAKIADYYDAYRHYAEILQRDDLQISFKLNPGDLMLFDNSRVMHARKAYSTGGKRHLQGAYSDLDGLYSTLRVLKSRVVSDLSDARQ